MHCILRKAYQALEKEKRRLQGELTKAQEENAALQQRLAETRGVAAAVAHDLNNPLTAITANLQLAKMGGDVDRYIEEARAAAMYMVNMVDALSLFARAGSEKMELGPVDTESLFAEVLRDLKPQIDEVGAEVTCESLPQVMADKLQLRRILQNLIGNALKFCSKTPKVHVSAELTDEGRLFSVKDNGIGIPASKLEVVFEMFQRVNREMLGGGMGLTICRKLVGLHGGRIWVESEGIGKGSTFYFTIPFKEEAQ